MKKSLKVGVAVVALLAISGTLLAQSYGTSTLQKMKEGVKNFTLSWDLNNGQSGLQSAPLTGKRTGDMLTAQEYNRMLELISEGGNTTVVNSGGTTGGVGIEFGGIYTKSNGVCVGSNPMSSGCSCPSGFTTSTGVHTIEPSGAYILYFCTRGNSGGTGGSTGGGSGWVDVSSSTAPFDLSCDYMWKVSNFSATPQMNSFYATRVNVDAITTDFSAGNYQSVNANNKRVSTGDHGTFTAQTFQRCGGVGSGGSTVSNSSFEGTTIFRDYKVGMSSDTHDLTTYISQGAKKIAINGHCMGTPSSASYVMYEFLDSQNRSLYAFGGTTTVQMSVCGAGSTVGAADGSIYTDIPSRAAKLVVARSYSGPAPSQLPASTLLILK